MIFKKADKEKSTHQPDFYFENGLMVFTEHYHLKRGHCCGSGCRHCPYKANKNNANKTPNP